MIKFMLFDRKFIFLLFIINLLGTIYGYYWYKSQLEVTPIHFLPFVPDSPTASLFFTIFLLLFLIKKQSPTIEALAFVSLVKYGTWAVMMNLLTLIVDGSLSWTGYMLMASHFAMALQAVLYAPLMRIKLKHLTIASIWILHNEIIDYVFDMMPTYSKLALYQDEIGYITFWLSIFTILLAYKILISNQELSLPKTR